MAAPTLGIKDFGLFSDEVYSSSELNRRTGEVLDHATKRPVTISRNKEQFALLKRDHAATLIRATLQFGPTLQLVQGALSVVEKKQPSAGFEWLKAFAPDDLRKMIGEVVSASVTALETGDWDLVNAIVHEWHESALVATSGVLDEAMKSTPEESPLPDPRSLTEAPTECAESRG
jgi:hypothetical protein